jgi:hypothetical protein
MTTTKLPASAIRTGHVIVSMWGNHRDELEVELVHREWFRGDDNVSRPVVRFTGWVNGVTRVERGYGQPIDGLVYVVGDRRGAGSYLDLV